MTITGEIVLCQVCMQWHETNPDPREDDSRPNAADYTYYVDNYKGVYGPICKEHDRDDISERKAKDIDNELNAEKFSL